ncbi:hypothetical protein, partial [Ideonella sp.]|uniref:hypothetical protein n=1 Tax=Ideonella sp. TaxID=1929293 RepID=UPI003BB766C2
MNPIRTCLLTLAAALPLVASAAPAADVKAAASAETLSARWAERETHFRQLIAPLSRDLSHEQMAMDLLRLEADAVARGTRLNDSRSEYYAELIRYVAASEFADPTEVLLLPSVLVSGGMATRGLARRGDAALAPLQAAAQLQAANAAYRLGATLTLKTMLQERTLRDAASQALAQSWLAAALNDSDPHVRMGAVDALAGSRDGAVRQRLADLARADGYA